MRALLLIALLAFGCSSDKRCLAPGALMYQKCRTIFMPVVSGEVTILMPMQDCTNKCFVPVPYVPPPAEEPTR